MLQSKHFLNFKERINKQQTFFWSMLVAMIYPIFFAYNWSIMYYAAVISVFVAIDFILTILVTSISNIAIMRQTMIRLVFEFPVKYHS